MRAVEHGLEPADLAALGREHDRPEWVAAAEVLREYDEVTALSGPGAYDPAWILGAAADLLEDDPEALGRLVRRAAARRRRRRPGAHLCSGPAAADVATAGPGPGARSATPTARSRPSAAPTRASSATAGPSWPGRGPRRGAERR